MPINVGDLVSPKTSAGLCLANVPCDGTRDQKRKTACVLRGTGVITEVLDIVIDYDTWDDIYLGVGEIPYQNCLVECEDGVGWGGEGALVLEEVLNKNNLVRSMFPE